jgi:hypothetical protein
MWSCCSGFQDQGVLIPGDHIELGERDIGFLVCTKGGWVPQNVCIPAGGDNIQLVGEDAESSGISGSAAADRPVCTGE